MKSLENLNFEQVDKLYSKFFSLGYLNTDVNEKFALISLICIVTKELRKKNQFITCYDVILKIGKDFPEVQKNTFFKSLGAICNDFMYGCKDFPNFGINVPEMPKIIKKILGSYIPF